MPLSHRIETTFVLSYHYGYGREQVAKALSYLIGQANLAFNRAAWEQILSIYVNKSWLSVVDIYLAVSA